MADASVKIRGGAGNATQIQSRDIDAVAPTDGQALAWSNSDSEWEPTTISPGSSEWTDTGSVLHPSEETVDNVVVGGTTTANSDIVLGVDGHAVFNEQGSDVDFRVEALGEANALVVQGSDGYVGIGLVNPNADLHVNGANPVIAIGSTSGTDPRLDFYDQGTTTIGASIFLDQDQDDLKILRTAGGTQTNGIIIDGSGNIGLGTLTPDSTLEVSKSGVAADTEVLISSYYDTEAITPKVTFRKADNTEASPALVDDNAVLGTIDFLGFDGTNFERGAKIESRVQGTPGSNDLPTELTFWTTPDNSNSCAEVMSLGADGAVALKFQSPSPSLTAHYAKIYALKENEPKFGTASCFLDRSTADYLHIPYDAANPDFNFGTGEFTQEMFARWDSTSGSMVIVEIGVYTTGTYLLWSNSNYFKFYIETTLVIDGVSDGAFTPTLGQWYHLAVTRDSSDDVRLFVDGTQVGSTGNDGGSITASGGVTVTGVKIGIESGLTASVFFDGYIDEIRFSDTARYTSNFTAPSAAFTDDVNTMCLLHCDGADDGTSFPDSSSKGQNATAGNGATTQGASGGTEMFVMDSSGNETKISPHNAEGEWEYYSKSPEGEVTRINMEEVVRDLGELTGKDYIKDE